MRAVNECASSTRRLVPSLQIQSVLSVPAKVYRLILSIATVVTVNTQTIHYNETMVGWFL